MRKRSTHCKVCGVELTNENNRIKMSRSAMCYMHWRTEQNKKAKELYWLRRERPAIQKWNSELDHRVRADKCKQCGIKLTSKNNGLPGMSRSALCFTHWRDKKNATFKRWYYKNHDKILAQKRALMGRHGFYYLGCRAKSFNYNNGGKFICREDIESMLAKQLRHCNICNSELVDKHWEIDHIVPKKLGGSHELSNLHIVCDFCNKGKWTLTLDQYVAHCYKIIEHDRMKKERENKSVNNVI